MARISADEVAQLRQELRRVLRGVWRRRAPLGRGFGRRHVGVLSCVATADRPTVGDVAHAVGLSLPAASKLARDLESAGLLVRAEDPDDRRRTVLRLDDETAAQVREWLTDRDRPLADALASLTAAERTAFLKGMHALADALMKESEHGSVGPHHRAPHHRGPHRHRPL
jgi:DNA-binding MarR family transcriptional regulator